MSELSDLIRKLGESNPTENELTLFEIIRVQYGIFQAAINQLSDISKTQGTPLAMVKELSAQNLRLIEENAALVEVIQSVEWAGYEGEYCPWCHKLASHAPDCQRQLALGLAEKEGEK